MQPFDLDLRQLPDPDWADPVQVKDWQEYSLWKAQAAPDDKRLRRVIQALFHDQGQRVMAALEEHWPIRKADEPEDSKILEILRFAFDVGQEDAAVRGVLMPEAQTLVVKYGADLLQQHNLQIPLVPTNPTVKSFMERYAASQVRHINEGTRAILRTNLVNAATNGEPIKAVLGRIRDVFEGDISVARAQKIARTELVTLSNNARQIAAKESGVLKKKRWVSEKLPTTRQEKAGANHMAMHGITVGIDETFSVPSRQGVDQMMTPGDLAGSAENVVNCVCVVRYMNSNAFDELFDRKE